MNGGGGGGGGGGSGTVTSVSASDGLFSVATPTTIPALSIAGTSGGVPYFNSASTWATSAALAANSLMIGGGPGVAPSTVTTNPTVLTALGAAPTGSGGIVLATSPTLVTPALGAATGTSLALGGATLGTSTLAVPAGACPGTPTIAIGNSTTGFCSVSTTGFEITVNGTNQLDYGITNGASHWTFNSSDTVHVGAIIVASNVIASGNVGSNSNTGLIDLGASTDTLLSRHCAACWQLGTADAAAPVAQTLGVQSVVAGTSNTAGANWTLNGSASTGSGTSGDIVLKTGGTGAGATVQNAEVTALTVKGATQNVVFAAGLVSSGTLPTLTTGTCSGSGAAGGSLAGTFVAATCAAGTYILSGLPTAPTGYSCNAEDRTTTADTLQQTAASTTSATFKATTATSDVIQFNCLAY